MPRLFIEPDTVTGDVITLEGDVFRHLAGSLRARVGDRVSFVCAGDELAATVTAFATNRMEATIVRRQPAGGEPGLHVEVIQALPKDHFDDAIDAMVQAGVSTIRPVLTERCVARPERDSALRRLQRWRAVAREAAQLAFRGAIPQVMPLADLDTALAETTSLPLLAAVISPSSTPLAHHRSQGPGVAICIGPEGGLGPGDLRLLDDRGATHVSLGARVLRARLAGAIAAAVLLTAVPDVPHSLTEDRFGD